MAFVYFYLIGMVVTLPICYIGVKKEIITRYSDDVSDYVVTILTACFLTWIWPVSLIAYILKLWDDKHDNSHTSNR